MNELAHRPGKLEARHAQVDFILLDGSASMSDKWNDTLRAIDAYVDVMRQERVNSQIILSEFSDSQRVGTILRDEHIDSWYPLSRSKVPFDFGGTALYDAINHMGRFMRDLDPPRASIVIATDGEECSSEYTDENQARSILDWCRAKGWQVTFIGCDFNNSKQAAKLGGRPETFIGVQKRLLSDAARNLAKKRAAYGLYGQDMHFSDDEKSQFGGYLAGPSK